MFSSTATASSTLSGGTDTEAMELTQRATSDSSVTTTTRKVERGESTEPAPQPSVSLSQVPSLPGPIESSSARGRIASRGSSRLSTGATEVAGAVTQPASTLLSSVSHPLSPDRPSPPPAQSTTKIHKVSHRERGNASTTHSASHFREWSTNVALLDEVMDAPLFHIIPKNLDSTACTLPLPAGGTWTPSADVAAAATAGSNTSVCAVVPTPHVSPTIPDHANRADTLTPTGDTPQTLHKLEVRQLPPEDETLPSNVVPTPSILLIALADLEVLQKSFSAHILVTPLKEQLNDLKQLVGSSMRSELLHMHTESKMEELTSGEQRTSASYANERRAAGERETVTTSATEGHGSAGDAAAAALGTIQAHNAVVSAALRAAHGYLYGNEVLPVGVPPVHLQRARREWVAQYGSKYVQPRLQQSQRRQLKLWAQQQRVQQVISGKRVNPRSRAVATPDLNPAMTPVALCAALEPSYWREVMTDCPIPGPTSLTTAHLVSANVRSLTPGGNPVGGAFLSPTPGHSQSPSRPRPLARVGAPSSVHVAWDVDLYDDLALVVSVEQREGVVQQTNSLTSLDAKDTAESAPMGAAASPPLASTTADDAVPAPLAAKSSSSQLLGRGGELYNMQLTLPVFVYVVSRYLFIAQYSSYFPAGLFSRALIDPFYFPDASQCTPEYALRAAPALQQEARRVYASYTAQLADVHRCFPEGKRSTEVPLSPRDTFHLWELLCPPQRQDVSGRWRPLFWGQLTSAEEETLLADEYKSVMPGTQGTGGEGVVLQEPLMCYSYARAARQTYRRRLQQLAQHPTVLDEVSRLFMRCEDVAFQFFSTMDAEQKGYVTWEAFTNALIEEADVVDHRRKVSERAAHLTRSSASVFDRYVVEPLAPPLVRLGYTGNVFEVRHSHSLVMMEGSIDYAVCDGTQLGSVYQRFLVRPMEVLCDELEGDSYDASGQIISAAGSRHGAGGGGDSRAGGKRDVSLAASDEGYDASLRRRPWRNNQRPPRVYVRYEDGRRLQEVTALGLLQQLGRSSPTGAGAGKDEEGSEGDGEGDSNNAHRHQSSKLVCLEEVLLVEGVSPLVPLPVFVARGNDMLLRLYPTSRAVQSMPEAGVLRCTETVSSMEWAAGGSGECRSGSQGVTAPLDGVEPGNHSFSSSSTVLPPHRRMHHDRLSVQRQEYLLLGTRSGTIIAVDLYAALNNVPRLATLAGVYHDNGNIRGGCCYSFGKGTCDVSSNGGMSSTMSAPIGAVHGTSERIGSSSNAWAGYRAIAQRTYYGDVRSFAMHTRQVHRPGVLVSSVMAVASSGLVVSSGLDGDVFTMRLAYSTSWMSANGSQRTLRRGVAGNANANTDMCRPMVRIEVLSRLHVCDAGVRHAIPVPYLSLLAVHTVTNKVYLYHTSVLATAPVPVDGGRGNSASSQVSRAVSSTPLEPSEGSGVGASSGVDVSSLLSSAPLPRVELYDASAPHLRNIVSMMVVEELDQLITIDVSGYVKVWSVRQTQPITSFYALSPLNTAASGSLSGAGWGSSQSSAASAMAGGGSRTSAYSASNKLPSASLLRMTKNSIEAQVEGAEYRLQPCRSAAYNYARRQIFVMGSNNAAHCFFLGGHTSLRAHTEPLRVLLVDTTPQASGGPSRLISLSSADCRLWTLLTGTMILGIRVHSSEYMHLMDRRIASNVRGKSPTGGNSKDKQRPDSKGSRNNRHSGSSSQPNSATHLHRTLNSAFLASSSFSTVTTGERQRLLPPSVDDVIHAVLAGPQSGYRRPNRLLTKPHDAKTAGRSRRGGGRASSQLLSLAGPPQGNTAAPDNSSGGGDDDVNGLLMNMSRDDNVLMCDIRCACLGGSGQWISYALIQGDIRLHRCDSGRLLRTFTTTPPVTEDLVEAVMQYQYLFPSNTMAEVQHAPSTDLSTTRRDGAGSSAGGGSSSPVSTLPPRAQSPMTDLTPVSYAQAVALVLQQMLTSTSGATACSAVVTSASGASGDVSDQLGRNVHREPLQILYLDESQELLVLYADGLVRVFSLLSYSSAASRVIVSRTLVTRALKQVRAAVAALNRPASLVRHRPATGMGASGGRSTTPAAGSSEAFLAELLMTSGVTAADVLAGGAGEVDIQDEDGVASGSRVGWFSNASAAEVMPPASPASIAPPPMLTRPASIMQALIVSLPEYKIDPDVVLLATASPPLGLVCLVHASGLVTVLDTQSRGEADGAARMRMLSSTPGGMNDDTGASPDHVDNHTRKGRAEACVVAHVFMTTDEVTAVTFLGAYPCLVLADRHRHLSFHLMRGSSLLALLGEFAEELEKDLVASASRDGGETVAEAQKNATLSGLSSGDAGRGAGRKSSNSQPSLTSVWTVSIDDTCASQRALGHVTALTFDALYATLYVGTSQGYIVSYLVRRFLTAFQLAPVFLRGVSGVAVSTYATELQRGLATTAHSVSSPGSETSSGFLYNYLRLVFDLPPAALAWMREKSPSAVQKQYATSNSPALPSSTSPNFSPKDISNLFDVYRNHRNLSQQLGSHGTGKLRDSSGRGSIGGTHDATRSRGHVPCTSSEVLTAAAVLHDAVTRMATVASATPPRNRNSSSASAPPSQIPSWWTIPGGRKVLDYVARKYGCSPAWSGIRESTGSATFAHDTLSGAGPRPTSSGELELNEEGVMEVRKWVTTALTEQRFYMQGYTGDAASTRGTPQSSPLSKIISIDASGAQGGNLNPLCHHSLSTNGSDSTGRTPISAPIAARDALAGGTLRADTDLNPSTGDMGDATSLSEEAASQQMAEALVQEVREEILGGAVTATTLTTTSSATSFPHFIPEAITLPNSITDSWVECLFTRHPMCTTSRSPLCLLTTPAMLERARRERQDRRRRIAAATAAAAGGRGGIVDRVPEVLEWDAYVEGSLPDYLTDILNHPNQGLTLAERKALQQRSITVLKCRRNGYLCVGHANGAVTLWTPYACAQLENLCPSTSLVTTLSHLGASVKAQFQYAAERAKAQRQRSAYDKATSHEHGGAVGGVAHLKKRIFTMLLEHHITHLQPEEAGDDEETHGGSQTPMYRGQGAGGQVPLSVPNLQSAHLHNPSSPAAQRHNSTAASADGTCDRATNHVLRQPFSYGSMESKLLAMRPLLCFLLGISSPAQLRARQLSLEDLFFLPFQMSSMASLEAFNPHCYDVAVDVAMCRLRRELLEEAEEGATEAAASTGQVFPDELTAAVVEASSTISQLTSPRAFHAKTRRSSSGAGAVQRRQGAGYDPLCPTRLASVYNYRLSSLVQAWCYDADREHCGALGAADFPGAVRLLVHRVMEGVSHLSNGALGARSSCSHDNAAQMQKNATTVNPCANEGTQGTAAQTGATQSLLSNTSIIADSAAPVDGEYYHVCHAMHVAEVRTEAQWEIEELNIVYQQLQELTEAKVVPSTTTRSQREAPPFSLGEDFSTQGPRVNTAAVSAAVNNQMKRSLVVQLSALSSRIAATSLLRSLPLKFRPPPAKPVPSPSYPNPDDGLGGEYAALQLTSFRQTGALGWVKQILDEQAAQAFLQPLLVWRQPASLPPSRLLGSPSIFSFLDKPLANHEMQHDSTPSSCTKSATVAEEALPLLPTNTLPTVFSTEGDGRPQTPPVACSKEDGAAAFLTEVPRNLNDDSVSLCASLSTPEQTALDVGHRAAAASTVGIRTCESSLSSRLPSTTDESLLYSAAAPPFAQKTQALLRGTSASGSGSYAQSVYRPDDARALEPSRGCHAVAPPSRYGRPPVALHSQPGPSGFDMTGSLTDTLFHSHSSPSRRPMTHRFAALRRAKLARTGSGGAVPPQRRSVARGLVDPRGGANSQMAVAFALPAGVATASATTTTTALPSSTVGDIAGGRGGGKGGRFQRSKAASTQFFTYYSLLNQAATTK